MPTALIVRAELANRGGDALRQEFRRLLQDATPDTQAFLYRPAPGTVVAAALDWQAVLGTGADLIAYSGILWTAYERFVKPRRKKRRTGETPAFLFVNVRQPGGDVAQFAIGHTYTDRAAFIEAFVSQAAALRSAEGPADETLIAELDREPDWVRAETEDDVHPWRSNR